MAHDKLLRFSMDKSNICSKVRDMSFIVYNKYRAEK